MENQILNFYLNATCLYISFENTFSFKIKNCTI